MAKNEKLDSSFVILGDKYVTLHNYSYAMECYREALKINPHNSMAFNRMILIPPHLTEHLSKKYSERKELDSNSLQTLAVYDTFRQTFIGGYIVLSKQVDRMSKDHLFSLLSEIQDLRQDYFDKHTSPLRDHGVLIFKKKSYVWMINSYENIQDAPYKNFPVLILMTRAEYQTFKGLIRMHH